MTRAFFRFHVPNTSRAASVSGGRIHAISDCDWNELTVTFNDEPLIDGGVLDSNGPVAPNQTVEFDVTSVVPGDGTYCFAIDNLSSDGVDYNSREATAGAPEFVVEVTP